MGEPVTSTGSSAESGSHPAEGVSPRAQRGPATIISPERRPGRTAPVSAAATIAARSSVVRLLFPPDDETAAATFDPGRGVQLGHFSIVERIRSGGMGAVFRAVDLRLRRDVALKVLPPSLSRDPLIVQRFKNEAQSAAQLDHENVARVFYVGEEHGLHFIAFEYVSGTNVRELIQEQGRLPVPLAVNYVLQIASALVHTSAQGVVHRDIKPSNIIVTPGGRAKLVDLGLARKENREDDAVDLTMAGTTLGTFDYISPEQARDPRTADVRSDIYSLGCTLYHMLTGAPPFPEGTVLQKLLQHQGDEAPDPTQSNGEVPENLSIVCRRMMAKDPRRRYQNAEQLVRDLMLVAGAMGLRSVSPEGLVWLSAESGSSSFWERHLAWMATAAALLVIILGLEYASSGRGDRSEENSQVAASNAGRQSANARTEGGRPAAGDDGRADEFPSAGDESPASTARAASESRPTGTATTPIDRSQRGADRDDDDTEIPPASVRPRSLAEASRSAVEGGFAVGPPLDGTAGAGRIADPDSPSSPRGNARRTAGESVRDDDLVSTPSERTADSSPPAAGFPRNSSPSRSPDAETPAGSLVPAPDDGIFLLGRDGAADRKFPTLAAACSEVRNDGAVIELRFDGRRVEQSLKIARKVAIRAARGRRPVVEFRPTQLAADGPWIRAISIPSGALDLVGVDLVLFVDDGVSSAESWSLFSLERPESLRLEKTTATIVNPRLYPVASIIELRPSSAALMPDMPAVGALPRPPLEIELADGLFRGQGQCDLVFVRHAEPARIALRHCVVAVQGSLLSSRGSVESMSENAQLELKLEHVTAGLGAGLIRLDSGSLPRKLSGVQVSAADSIFANAGGAPLVSMTGSSPPQDFRTLLVWNGRNNVYDRYQTFWWIAPMEGAGRTESLDFSAWRRNWTDASEANARVVDAGIWTVKDWGAKSFAELTAADFALDRQLPSGNPAVSGATNSTDAGANLSTAPRPAAPASIEPHTDGLRD